MSTDNKDVLEQNVSDLIESGGASPKLEDHARSRIREALVAKYAVAVPKKQPIAKRRPLIAVGLGFAATAAVALVIVNHASPMQITTTDGVQQLADGTTYVTEPGAKIEVLGPRKVRVTGVALLDVVPGKGVFVVETARGRIEVLGTRFVVDGAADKTSAAVVRGEVKLASSDGEVTLHAGEQATALPGHAPVRGPAPRLSHLVSWAQSARHEAEHDLASHHGTLFARDPGVRSHAPWGEEYPLPIAKLGVDIEVEDQVARVALDQTFHNNAPQDLEGMYRFAIPPDAALQRLAMYVDGKLTESAVVERMRARRIYEELVYRRVDPALLEWAGVGRLALRVYPLKAQEDKRLMLAYTQSLPKLYDDYTITVPLPDVDQTVGVMDIAVRLKGCGNCEVQSTSHAVTTEHAGADTIVKYHHADEKLGDSFVLHVRDSRKAATVRTQDDFMLVRSPVELGAKAPAYKPRTWLILDDVSASRSTAELRAQRDLITAMVGELDENDKVGVIAFDVQARKKLALTRVLDVDKKELRRSLEHEGGVGATDFDVALGEATKQLAGVDPDSAMIVYLGDGLITSGTRHLDELRSQLSGKAHFIGVGIGDGPDTQTLSALAAATGGYTTTMDLADDLQWRAFDLVAALHTARVTGLEAKLVDATGAAIPATTYLASPQLADGEELELVAKLASDHKATSVELTGTLDGAPWHQVISLANGTNTAGYLPRMWAQRHIAARLLAKQEPVVMAPCVATKVPCPTEAEARETRDESIRKEVVGLGKKYFLLSRHTSLLVLENDEMYRQYDLQRDSGATWAPYAMPATVPVVKAQLAPMLPVDVEVARAPLQIFVDNAYAYRGWEQQQMMFQPTLGPVIALATPSLDSKPAERDRMRFAEKDVSRAEEAGGGEAAALDDNIVMAKSAGILGTEEGELEGGFGFGTDAKDATKFIGKGKFGTIGHGSGTGSGYGVGGGRMGLRSYHATSWYAPSLARLNYPQDVTFDDVTNFVPGMSFQAEDAIRRSLGHPTQHTISDAARTLLEQSRKQLPTGVYRWADHEIAVDSAHHLGSKFTTGQGLVETAAYDGAKWTKRYAELGLDVVRPIGSDDVAIGLAYLPLWIADPAHYAQYFDVAAQGRAVTLSTIANGKAVPAFVMTFDDQARLVSIADGNKHVLVSITWGTQGPTAAMVDGDKVVIGFVPQTIADATAWALTSPAGVVVEEPGRSVAYWRQQTATPGSPEWRRVQRQLMVAAAAVRDLPTSQLAFEALRTQGGVELGDLVLASQALVERFDEQHFAKALEGFPRTGVAQYLAAGRGYLQHPERPQPMTASNVGMVGALSQLRLAEAQLVALDAKAAANTVAAMSPTAPDLRLVAAMFGQFRYDLPLEPLLAMTDAAATGPNNKLRNIVRAQAATLLQGRSKNDEAATRVMALADDLDLDALPPQLQPLEYTLSPRGQVAIDLFYAKVRAKIITEGSYAWVMAFMPLAQQHQDVVTLLERASVLAGNDAEKQLGLAEAAIGYGQATWAHKQLAELLKASPTRGVYQLAGQNAQSTGDLEQALTYFEKAQALGDDQTTIVSVRGEMSQILSLLVQLAKQSTGTARDAYVQRAMAWGEKWRVADEGNAQIEQTLGELLFSVGDEAGAWRQLSSQIERDPWVGTGYMAVAEAFERHGKVAEALPFWQQAIVIDQTNPTPLLRKAQALLALNRKPEAVTLLAQIKNQKWHDVWQGVVYQAQAIQQAW